MNEKEQTLYKKLRRALGKTHLDAVHMDLINALTGPDLANEMLDLIAEKNPQLYGEHKARMNDPEGIDF